MAKDEKWINETVILREVRLGFPNLFTAVGNPNYPDQKPAYNAQFEIVKDSDNEKKLNTAITKVLKETYAEKAGKKLNEYKVNKMKYPIKDGDDMEKEWSVGKVYLTARRTKTLGSPKVINQVKEDITDEDLVPNGSIVNVKVNIACQTGPNDGVRCQLLVVQFVKKGEGFAPDIDDSDFEEIEIADDEELI